MSATEQARRYLVAQIREELETLRSFTMTIAALILSLSMVFITLVLTVSRPDGLPEAVTYGSVLLCLFSLPFASLSVRALRTRERIRKHILPRLSLLEKDDLFLLLELYAADTDPAARQIVGNRLLALLQALNEGDFTLTSERKDALFGLLRSEDGRLVKTLLEKIEEYRIEAALPFLNALTVENAPATGEITIRERVEQVRTRLLAGRTDEKRRRELLRASEIPTYPAEMLRPVMQSHPEDPKTLLRVEQKN